MTHPLASSRSTLVLLVAALLLSCDSGSGPDGNARPSATISTPSTGVLFSGGETIDFAGTGSDAEDGTLPAAAFTWWVDLHHDQHTHPMMPKTTGIMSGSVFVPPRGHPEENIFIRINLVVVDTDGVADTSTVDVQPRKVTLSFASVPTGAQLTLDGQPRTTPFSVTGVVGMERDIGAPTPQVVVADSMVWQSWSDAGANLHTVVTPATSMTYTATYQVVAVVNQHPAVSIMAPSNGATIVLGTVTTVSATASDADGTVAMVEFFDGAAPIGTDNTGPYSIAWTPSTVGPHTLTARATDNGTATTTSTGVAVTVAPPGSDLTPPTAQLTAPTDGTTGLSGTVSLTATASDNVGVVGVTFQLDGVALSEDLSPPYQASVPATSAFASGVHVIRARARDAAGNLSPWSAVRVTFIGSALPAGFSRTTFVSGLNGTAPAMAFAPDERLFIAEQTGALRVVKNGVLLPAPFATVTTTAVGERGLLGVAFHPQFATNGWVYVYYTSSSGGVHNRISRFTASGDVASGGETVLVDLPNLSSADNHNGGALHFGPDGKLYVAVGDNATGSNAQSMTIPFGKMLRFNDDGTIPNTNPFFGSTTGINQSIWALGLRNPFTFAFQPVTGRMFISDVGQADWEEVDEGQAGGNFGWPTFEGVGGAPTYIDPLYAYGHSGTPNNQTLVTGNCIVGAGFYGPAATLYPAEYQGSYFFADCVGSWVKRLDTVNGNAVYSFWNGLGGYTTDVQVGPDGAVYVLADMGGGWGVHRIGRP